MCWTSTDKQSTDNDKATVRVHHETKKHLSDKPDKKDTAIWFSSSWLINDFQSESRAILDIGSIQWILFVRFTMTVHLSSFRYASFAPFHNSWNNLIGSMIPIGYSIDANLHKTNKANWYELKEERTWANNIIIGFWCRYSSCRSHYMEFSPLFARFPACLWIRTIKKHKPGSPNAYTNRKFCRNFYYKVLLCAYNWNMHWWIVKHIDYIEMETFLCE